MLNIIKEIINSPKSKYETGTNAKFKRISEDWGIKFFSSVYMRDYTHTLQKHAYEIGCAPQLGEKFQMKTPDGEMIYGYITEFVNPFEEPDENGLYSKFWEINDREYNALMKKLSKIMKLDDMHGGNIGYTKDGRLVAFDFSHCESSIP